MKKLLLPLALSTLVALPIAAQSSASFRLEEHSWNAGGHPEGGAAAASASFRISLASIGDSVVRTGLSSPSFRADTGYAFGYAPPAEVLNLVWSSATTLEWSADGSVGSYNLYRDLVGTLSGLGFGQCEQQGLTGSSTTDTDTPGLGAAYFYLVTAVNRLAEEGPKGLQSDGTPRQGNACP